MLRAHLKWEMVVSPRSLNLDVIPVITHIGDGYLSCKQSNLVTNSVNLCRSMLVGAKTRGPIWPCIAYLSTRPVPIQLAFRFRKRSSTFKMAAACVSDWNDLSYFYCTNNPDISHQVSSPLPFWFRRTNLKKICKMAAILDF